MPTTVGPDDGTVVISSNDPNEAEYSLSLVAEVIPAPVFVLSEESITVDMVSYAKIPPSFIFPISEMVF